MKFEDAVKEVLASGPMVFGDLQLAVAERGIRWDQHGYEHLKASGQIKAVVKASQDEKPKLVVSLN